MTDAKPNPNCTYCGGEGTDRSTKLGESRIVSCDFCHHEGDFDPAVGAKFDEGKLRYDLIPPEALAEWVRVLTYGAEKYSDRNWENGIDTGRLFAAMQRHAWAWHGGEELDPEMQIHHMAAVMFNAAAIVTYYHRDRIDQAFGPTMEQVFDDVVRRGAGVTVTRVDPDEAYGPTASVDTYDEAAPLPPEAFTREDVWPGDVNMHDGLPPTAQERVDRILEDLDEYDPFDEQAENAADFNAKAAMFREFAGMTYTLSGDQTKGGDVKLDGVWYNKLSLKPSGGSMLDDVAVEKTYRKDDPLREERRGAVDKGIRARKFPFDYGRDQRREGDPNGARGGSKENTGGRSGEITAAQAHAKANGRS